MVQEHFVNYPQRISSCWTEFIAWHIITCVCSDAIRFLQVFACSHLWLLIKHICVDVTEVDAFSRNFIQDLLAVNCDVLEVTYTTSYTNNIRGFHFDWTAWFMVIDWGTEKMQSSEAVKGVLQDTHLLKTSLGRPQPTQNTRTTTGQRPRPVSGKYNVLL